MPEWLWIIIIGGVVIGMVSLIYKIQDNRIFRIEGWKEKIPMTEEILTKSFHANLCKDNMKEVKDLMVDNREILMDQIESIKRYFDLKIEKEILAELRKMNGGS